MTDALEHFSPASLSPQASLRQLWSWQADQDLWHTMSLDLGPELKFLPPSPTSLLRTLAPRVGDIDLDGFPDILITVYNTTQVCSGDVLIGFMTTTGLRH